MIQADLTQSIQDIGNGEKNRNLESYKDLLISKLKFMKEDNARLQSAINKKSIEMNNEQKMYIANFMVSEKEENAVIPEETFNLQKICKLFDLKPSEWADPRVLEKKLEELDIKIKVLQDDIKRRFVRKESHDKLVQTTLQKEGQCEAFHLINKTLKAHVKRLKVAIEAAEISAYHEHTHVKRDTKALAKIVNMVIKSFDAELGSQDFHINNTVATSSGKLIDSCPTTKKIDIQVDDCTGGEDNESEENTQQIDQSDFSIDTSLQTKLDKISCPKSFDVKNSFADDDPSKEQEAEMTMDYVEYFSRLFSARKFEEAAFHAIYSPKGILRTPQTMKYFKDIDAVLKKKDSKHKSYLLHYCKLLMGTVDLVGKQPSSSEVIEAFKSAVYEDHIDLVEYWIAKDNVMLSEPIGNILMRSCQCSKGSCVCKNVMLAEIVFKKLKAYHQSIHVLLHQGRYASALSYAKNEANFNIVDYARLLEENESFNTISHLMIELYPNLPLEEIIIELVSSEHHEKALFMLKICANVKRILDFGYQCFFGSEISEDTIRKFCSLCLSNGFTQEGYEFVSSYLVAISLKHGKDVFEITW